MNIVVSQLILVFLIVINFYLLQAQPLQVSVFIDSVSCKGGSDGAVYLQVSGGTVPQTSTKGLLISEFQADPVGTDSPFEFVELLATKSINFSVTPYTIIFVNNGTANASGWIAGGSRTYAFQISSGSVNAGDVIYVGGSSMLPQNNRFRVIDTGTQPGDGGIGNPDPAGVLGNGGPNADAIGVFNLPVSAITAATEPIDAIFFGAGVGQAVVSGGTAGYQLPVNDHYNGGKLQSNSFLAPNPVAGNFIKAEGVYDVITSAFTTARVWTVVNTFSDMQSSVVLDGIYRFQWSNGATTQNLTGLPATSNLGYTVINGADTLSGVVTIHEPEEVGFQYAYVIDATCYGAANGEVVSYAGTGGTPPYTYQWSGGSSENLPAGNYQVTVIDSKGCSSIPYSFAVSQPDSMYIIPNITPASSASASDGEIHITVEGGTPPYLLHWSDNQFGDYRDNLEAGNYCVTVSDNNGCQINDCFFVNFVVGTPHHINNPLSILYKSSYIIIRSTAKNLINVSVFSLSGQIVAGASRKTGDEEIVIHTQNLSSGIYLVRIQTENSIAVKRISLN
jgi:hypothetical protein